MTAAVAGPAAASVPSGFRDPIARSITARFRPDVAPAPAPMGVPAPGTGLRPCHR